MYELFIEDETAFKGKEKSVYLYHYLSINNRIIYMNTDLSPSIVIVLAYQLFCIYSFSNSIVLIQL